MPESKITAIDYPRNSLEFQDRFHNDAACSEYLAKLRWGNGFICPRCGHPEGWRTKSGGMCCAKCDSKISVTSGTIFHHTRIPLRLWFLAAWKLAGFEQGTSATDLQKELGLTRYSTAWTIRQKVYRALNEVGRERLKGRVEIGEMPLIGGKPFVEGEGAGERSTVGIAVEVVQDPTSGKSGFTGGKQPLGSLAEKMGCVRLAVLPNFEQDAAIDFVMDVVEKESRIITDRIRRIWILAAGYIPSGGKPSRRRDGWVYELSYVGRVIDRFEKWRHASGQTYFRTGHLQTYLDEFVTYCNCHGSVDRGLLFHRLLRQAVVTNTAAED